MEGDAMRYGAKPFLSLAVLLIICFVVGASGSTAFSATPACNVSDMQAFVNQHSWPMTISSAGTKTVTGSNVTYCDVIAYLVTDGEGAGKGLAGIEMGLPTKENWNQKFLFLGNGGLAGTLSLSAGTEGLNKGYAVAMTDMGHTASPTAPIPAFDASWQTINGQPNAPALVDYYYRATHQTTVAGKEFVRALYGKRIKYAYYQGCSTGGRQGLMEAEAYPDDFDGIIAGSPVMDLSDQGLSNVSCSFAFMKPSSAWINPSTDLAIVDAAVKAACGDPDNNGLVQNPLTCSFDLNTLICNGTNAGKCLTKDQVTGLIRYARPLISQKGAVLTPGFPITDLAAGLPFITMAFAPFDPANPSAWFTVRWAASDNGFKAMNGPGFQTIDFPIWFDKKNRAVVDEAARQENLVWNHLGDTQFPERMERFLRKEGKIIIYHGLSDTMINPFQTMQFYKDLATITPGGYQHLQRNARLFMVPNMLHCGGGSGPNSFDTLIPLEKWVEQGIGPEALVATTTTTPARTMPLCKFPEIATYFGSGDKGDASNWYCHPFNRGLLGIGDFGKLVGFPYTYLDKHHDDYDCGR
jgi:feruloyl esterase